MAESTSAFVARDETSTEFDVVSLGEVLLRLDPGPGRIRDAVNFDVHIGGGEFNVAVGASRCFGLRAAVVTALADNEVGVLMESLIRRAGVDAGAIRWSEDNGTGATARNGLNFVERGFGIRAGLGVSDRANTAAARLSPGDVDWDDLFGGRGVRWFHTGGVFTALAPNTAELALEAVRAARRHDVVVSYDINYRPSLWRALGDPVRHARTVSEIFEHVDILIGNEPEYRMSIGESVGGEIADTFQRLVEHAAQRFPTLKVIAATQRRVQSASSNDWWAVGWSPQTGIARSVSRERLEVLDRIGAGDSFVAGLAYGLLTGRSLQDALELGAAHGALVMTTPGDITGARLVEVEQLAAGRSAGLQR